MGLTQSYIDMFAKVVSRRDALSFDDEVHELALYRPAGRRPMFVVRYNIQGEAIQETIGKPTKISLKKARKIARKMMAAREAIPPEYRWPIKKKRKNKNAPVVATENAQPKPAPPLIVGRGPRRLLRYPDLKEKRGIGYTRRHLYRLEAAGKFPKRVNMSEGAVGWVESEIDEYLEKIITDRG